MVWILYPYNDRATLIYTYCIEWLGILFKLYTLKYDNNIQTLRVNQWQKGRIIKLIKELQFYNRFLMKTITFELLSEYVLVLMTIYLTM